MRSSTTRLSKLVSHCARPRRSSILTLRAENTWPGKVSYQLTLPYKAFAAGTSIPVSVRFSPLAKGVRVLSLLSTIREHVYVSQHARLALWLIRSLSALFTRKRQVTPKLPTLPPSTTPSSAKNSRSRILLVILRASALPTTAKNQWHPDRIGRARFNELRRTHYRRGVLKSDR